MILKYKNDDFRETTTTREISPEKLQVLSNANAVAEEWVTLMRLSHVLDKIDTPYTIEKTGEVVKAMISDVKREGSNEINWSKNVEKAIGSKTALIYKKWLTLPGNAV